VRAAVLRLGIAVVLGALLAAAPLGAAAPADPRTLTFPPLRYAIPVAERFTLDNGLTVLLITDHELPLVRITAYIGVGSVYEPDRKCGLAALTGTMIRRGGFAGKTPAALDAELEFMASSVESGIGDDAGSLSMTTLRKNFGATLNLFAGVMQKPAFDRRRFAQAVNETLEALRRRNDDPREVADRELRRAIYRGHPLGRVPTPATIRAITRDDLRGFHRRYYRPNNVLLAVSGDIDRAELEARLKAVFGRWKAAPIAFPRVPGPDMTLRPEMLHVNREGAQSVIRMGHIGITKDNPDLYAIRVMDFILGGGGLNSRLMSQIRADEGLAYNVAGYFEVGRRFPGPFWAETETKTASTGRTIGLMLDIMDRIRKAPVSEQELSLAREAMINAFVFGFADADRVVNQRARIAYYGYPDRYLEDYCDNIAKVTQADVLRVARRYLHPDKLIKVVVGDGAGFDRPLSAFGEVREIRPEAWTGR